jgi:hypothetical protein
MGTIAQPPRIHPARSTRFPSISITAPRSEHRVLSVPIQNHPHQHFANGALRAKYNAVITGLLLFALIVTLTFFVLLLAYEFLPWALAPAVIQLHAGDSIIYRKQKYSTHPGRRAYEIHPTTQGDDYSYFVDKFWTVENVLRDGRIVVTTRTHKHHYLLPNDPNLRRAGFIARLRYRNRFPHLEEEA